MVTELTMQDIQTPVDKEDTDIHVVMFYGTTCGPCKFTMPNYEQMATEFTELNARMKFHTIDAWAPQEQRDYCLNTHNVKGVPHFKAFCKEQVIFEKTGGGDLAEMHKMAHEIIDEAFKKFGEKY